MTPLDQITRETLEAMIGRDAEGQRLEFKRDIPVHPQSERDQRRAGVSHPRDAWWLGKPMANHGRDKLLEEIVAFANAAGGRVVLGIDEEDITTLAKEICPVPRISELEDVVRNMLLACVEPRLPQSSVRGIETDAAGGGVLVIDVTSSRLGPHRVVGTREVPVRRGDKCMSANMSEIHNMVLTNSRRLGRVNGTIDAYRAKALEYFRAFTDEPLREELVGEGGKVHRTYPFGVAIHVSVVAHDDFGIARLGDYRLFVPPKLVIATREQNGWRTHPATTNIWAHENGQVRRFIGGLVQQDFGWRARTKFSVSRDGAVDAFFAAGCAQPLTLGPHEVVGLVACCLGMFDRLRKFAEQPDMPGEVGIEILAKGLLNVANPGMFAALTGSQLRENAELPSRTVASYGDFSEILQVSAQDFFDAADCREIVPQFSYVNA